MARIDISELRPFHGYQSSIMPLSSGHYFYLASWDSSPTRLDRFSNVWLVTPQDRRILFCDPPESSEIVTIYHDFDEIHGASISVDWAAEGRLRVRCVSPDSGYELEAAFDVDEPLLSRLLVAVGVGPPTPLRLSTPVIAASNFLLNAVVAKGGAILTGVTETGQPFYHGDAERLYRVVSGAISINGEQTRVAGDAGRRIEFGDAVPFVRQVIKLGTLYLPYSSPRLPS